MTASHLSFLHPDGWAPPRGYANGVAAEGRTVFVAGQVGWNARGEFETDDFVAQVEQALQTSWPFCAPAAPGRSTWCG